MSVIIRLQNLPWSANALDIRTFFRGLSIPDGGVHIVGGEMGDAFIAFSTDEDARQAMLLDRGKINEVQIRLLLSSRAEMQKVIETARQTSISMMQLAQKQKPKPQQQQPQKPIQQQQKPPIQSSPIPPQPPVITSASIKNILSQPTQHNFGPSENSMQSYQSYNQFNENSMDSRDSRDNKFDDHGRSGRDRSHELDRGRQRYRSRSRSRSRDRRRSRSRDRSGSRRRKDRSISRDRRDRHRNSRSRDRSRSRENDNKNRRDRDTRDPRDPRDKGSLYDHRDPREPRDPRERLLKGRGDNSDTTNIPMVIVDDDEEKDDGFSQQKKNVNIWDVPPPTATPQNNYNQQGFKLFGQSQVPSYQSAESKMSPYNPMRNQYQEQNKQTNLQQSQHPMVTQQNQFPQQQQPHYQSLAQNFSTLQNQQYEAFQNALRTSSANNQGANQQSSEKIQPDKMNSQTTAGNESKDNPIMNFQNLVSSNLMSSLNYFGSNSKSTPFTNPYTLASKTSKDGSPIMKEENNPAVGRSTTSFSGLFGNNANKDEYTPRNVNESMGSNNQGRGSEMSSPKDSLIQRGGSDPNKSSPQALDPKEINYDEIKGNCIKISNMCPSTSYSDLRRFFSGLYIANNGIKMINDKHGLRIGVAYVHFVRPESKPKAFIRNGLALKSKKVIIESCTEEEFEDVVDSYKPARKPSRFEQADERNSLNKKDDDKMNEDAPDKIIEETPFTALLLEDVPPFATEQNIIKMFSSYTLIDIILTKDEESRKQLIGYVKFHRAEDAKKALEEKSSHLIGHKQVFVSRCSDEDFDKAKEKQNMATEVTVEEEQEEEEPEQQQEESKDQNNVFNPFKNSKSESKPPASNNNAMTQNFDETQQSMSNMSEMDSQIPSLLTMPSGTNDPRRRGGRQGSRFNRPEENTNRQSSTPYVLIKNCDYKSTKYDFADIFLNIGITPNRIEILYNNRELPSGECIVEFTCPEDAEKALARNNTKCGNRMIRLELIPPSFVADRLGENFLNQGNNRPDGYQNMPPFNGNNTEMDRNFGPNMNMNMGNMNMGMNSPFHNNMNPMNNMNSMNNMNNMPDNNMMGNQNAFRPGGNNLNPNRRGPKKSRFSDYNENPRSFGGNQNSNNGNNMPTNMPPNMPPNMNMHQNMPPPLNNSSVDQFGQPDCVVGMENVPYKAGIEDILEFFRKFNVQPHNVIRRYNDDGTPTGDARVAFSSPMEARAAIESKRNQKIFNRTIFLSIV